MRAPQDSVHASLEQLQELELQMHTVTASESLRDTLRAERTFAFQVLCRYTSARTCTELDNSWPHGRADPDQFLGACLGVGIFDHTHKHPSVSV